MKKHLLVCGCGSGMEHSLLIIREFASKITIITDRPSDAMPYGDQIIEAYPRDVGQVFEAIKKTSFSKPDGVISLGYENGPVISKLAEFFDCPHLPYEIALNATHKNRRIEILHGAGVNVPRHVSVQGIETGLSALKGFGLPCVVKPNDKTSSLGVSIVRSFDDAEKLVEHACSFSGSNTIVIEQFLEGSEHSIEGIIYNGQVYVTAFGDRNYSEKYKFAPFVFENGDNLPSKLSANEKDLLVAATLKAVHALQLKNTVFKGDLLLSTDGVPYVLELIPRLSGARWGTELIPLSTGVQILRNAVRLAFGEEINMDELKETITPNRHVVARFLANTPGKVSEIGDISKLKDMPNIYDANWETKMQVGDDIDEYRSGKDVLACVISTGESFEEAEKSALAALEKLPLLIE